MIYKHRYCNLAMQEYDCYAGAASIVSASKREQAIMLLLICSIEANLRLLDYMCVTHFIHPVYIGLDEEMPRE